MASSSLVRPKPRSKKTAKTTASAVNNNSSVGANASNISSSNNSSSSSVNRPTPIPLTHTNTDGHCLPVQGSGNGKKFNRVQHWLYLARLYNGFYMLTAREQLICHMAGWMVAFTAGLYFFSFLSGFYNGFTSFPQQDTWMIVEQ